LLAKSGDQQDAIMAENATQGRDVRHDEDALRAWLRNMAPWTNRTKTRSGKLRILNKIYIS
jgi:hypothetical protein